MPLVMLVGAHSLNERVGAFVLAVDLTVGRISPVSAVAGVVKRARLGMTSGVPLSVTQRSNGIFLFSDLNE